MSFAVGSVLLHLIKLCPSKKQGHSLWSRVRCVTHVLLVVIDAIVICFHVLWRRQSHSACHDTSAAPEERHDNAGLPRAQSHMCSWQENPLCSSNCSKKNSTCAACAQDCEQHYWWELHPGVRGKHRRAGPGTFVQEVEQTVGTKPDSELGLHATNFARGGGVFFFAKCPRVFQVWAKVKLGAAMWLCITILCDIWHFITSISTSVSMILYYNYACIYIYIYILRVS